MKAKDIRQFTAEELQQKRREIKEELFNLRVQQKVAGRQVERPSRIRDLRREVARVETILRERQLAEKAT